MNKAELKTRSGSRRRVVELGTFNKKLVALARKITRPVGRPNAGTVLMSCNVLPQTKANIMAKAKGKPGRRTSGRAGRRGIEANNKVKFGSYPRFY